MKNKRVNVLYVEENRDGTVGGSHYCLIDLIKVLDKKKYRTITMFYEANALEEKFKEIGSEVVVYKKPIGKNWMKLINNGPLKIFKPVPILIKIAQVLFNIINTNIIPFFYIIYYIIKNDIDIIHMNDTVFSGLDWVFAAKLTGKKIIGHERGYHKEIPPYGLPNTAFHTKYYDYILGMSLSVKKNLEDLGVELKNYSTFYDRTDIEEFQGRINKKPFEIRRELEVKEGIPLIGIVGNIQRWKGQWTIVEALNKLKTKYPDIKCIFVGNVSDKFKDDIDYHNELNQKINDYGLEKNITITGYRDDVPDLVNAMDICIHASTNPEPWGLVVLEAMVLGKPLIAANIGGPVEIIVNDESGILIEPGNPDALAKKLDLLLKDEILRKKIGKAAFQRVKDEFSQIDIGFIEDLYNRLLNNRN